MRSVMESFRGQEAGREPYRFTVDNLRSMQRIGVISDKAGIEPIEGLLLMRSSDIPVRLHSSGLLLLYEAGVIPAEEPTEMVEGVVYHAKRAS